MIPVTTFVLAMRQRRAAERRVRRIETQALRLSRLNVVTFEARRDVATMLAGLYAADMRARRAAQRQWSIADRWRRRAGIRHGAWQASPDVAVPCP